MSERPAPLLPSPGPFPPSPDPVLFREMEATWRLAGLLERVPLFTWCIILINVLVYGLMAWEAVRTGAEPGAVLLTGGSVDIAVRWGAKDNLLVDAGQVWRLVTCGFVHFGIVHIICNMVSLKNLGVVVENVYGWAAFLVVYAAGLLGGSLASWWFPREDAALSAGASGAILGLVGALLVVVVRYRRILPRHFVKVVSRNLAIWGGLILVLGFLVEFIDNAGHVGGFIGGALAALAVPAFRLVPQRARGQRLVVVLAGLAVLLVAVSAAAGVVADRSGESGGLSEQIRRGRVGRLPWRRHVAGDLGLAIEVLSRARVSAERGHLFVRGGRYLVEIVPVPPGALLDPRGLLETHVEEMKDDGIEVLDVGREERLLIGGRSARRYTVLARTEGGDRQTTEIYHLQGRRAAVVGFFHYPTADLFREAIVRHMAESLEVQE